VKSYYAKYSPERLQEILAQLTKLDISEETAGRKAEAPLFRALAHANLDIWGHVNPDDPAMVTGAEFDIELLDNTPPDIKMRPLSPVKKAFLHWRIQYLIYQKKLRRTKGSPYNNPPVLVPYPDRIAAFFKKHGSNAIAALMDPVNQVEVRQFFRLTQDFRALNALTKPSKFPLPNIISLLDRCTFNSTRYSSTDIEDAFFTILLKEACREFTAFQTPDGCFEYCVMPQGTRNAATYWAYIHCSHNFRLPLQ
jgi:hypothetical protein